MYCLAWLLLQTKFISQGCFSVSPTSFSLGRHSYFPWGACTVHQTESGWYNTWRESDQVQTWGWKDKFSIRQGTFKASSMVWSNGTGVVASHRFTEDEEWTIKIEGDVILSRMAVVWCFRKMVLWSKFFATDIELKHCCSICSCTLEIVSGGNGNNEFSRLISWWGVWGWEWREVRAAASEDWRSGIYLICWPSVRLAVQFDFQ